MPKVYLLQEPTSEKDLSSAAKYGAIFPIIDSKEKVAMNIESVFNLIYDALENYDPDADFICFAGGDPLLEFMAGIIISRLGFTEVTHLVWNRERNGGGYHSGQGYYMPKTIKLGD